MSVAYREKGEFTHLFRRTLLTAASIGLVPAVTLYLIAPECFALIAGEKWRTSGEYARNLAVSGYFQFVAGPIDKGALIVGATRYVFVWNFARLLSLVALFTIGFSQTFSISKLLGCFAALNSAYYLLDIIVGYRLASGNK